MERVILERMVAYIEGNRLIIHPLLKPSTILCTSRSNAFVVEWFFLIPSWVGSINLFPSIYAWVSVAKSGDRLTTSSQVEQPDAY
jgi:hypothetical protein